MWEAAGLEKFSDLEDAWAHCLSVDLFVEALAFLKVAKIGARVSILERKG